MPAVLRSDLRGTGLYVGMMLRERRTADAARRSRVASFRRGVLLSAALSSVLAGSALLWPLFPPLRLVCTGAGLGFLAANSRFLVPSD